LESIIKITSDPLDASAIRSLVESISLPSDGGIVVFEGVVRDNARGRSVRYLEYDAYPEMALEQMRSIAAEVESRWATHHLAMVHRIGRMEIGECCVVVAVACPHRAEAFAACQYAIDTLKARVPIFKKEILENGEEWVEG
jgi:molybdopterin synthase catalytic subunit